MVIQSPLMNTSLKGLSQLHNDNYLAMLVRWLLKLAAILYVSVNTRVCVHIYLPPCLEHVGCVMGHRP